MHRRFLTILLIVPVLLAACGGAQGTDPGATNGDVPPVVSGDDALTAEGRVEPARSVTLRAPNGAQVTEVLVNEGDRVEADASLVRLDPTDAENAVRQAEAGLAAAEAQLAQAKAGAREEQIAILEAQLEAAQAAVAQAVAQQEEETAGLDEAEILEGRAAVIDARSAHRRAEEAHDQTMECYTVDLPDGTQQEVCPALGANEEIARQQMEAAYSAWVAAQAQLDALQGSTKPQLDSAAAALKKAIAQRDALQAQLDRAKAGSRAEEIAAAEAGVQQAQSALAQARSLLDLAHLEAPFAGTVTDLPLAEGDVAAAGDPLATIATVDRWQIQVTDLSELDVRDVQVGEAVVVTLDAMPERVVRGRVQRVDRQGVDVLGDVVYPVIIELEEAPDWLRWGMTAQVTFGEELVGSPVVPEAGEQIVAEASAEPVRWSGLRFVVDGEVAEVLVSVGDRVEAGDVLMRLDATNAQLSVQEAEAALATAEARLALQKAGARPEDVAAVEAQVEAAQSDLRQAVAARDRLEAGITEAERAGAQLELEQALAAEKQAEVELSWARDRDDEDTETLAEEQLRAARVRVEAAQARLAALPEVADARERAADAGVWAAQAQVEEAQAQLDLLQAGATEEEIRVVEAEVQQAKAALAAAQTALDRRTLRAPYAGTVTQVHAEEGDLVTAGRTVLVFGALDQLQFTTTDLLELDVVDVEVGESVTVTVDAFPEQPLEGHVVSIDQQSVMDRSDVTYPVVIALDEPAPELRWGMTALVEIPR